MKKKLFISFSMGETSAYMTWWCINHLKDEYDIIVGLANTGQERNESLDFGNKVQEFLGVPVVWLQAVPMYGFVINGKKELFTYAQYRRYKKKADFSKYKKVKVGSKHKVVTYETADRIGYTFEAVIEKYGIPNVAFKHCNRELKLNPIKSYLRSIGWNKYYTAIGIRADEMDRINFESKDKKRLIYPLAESKYKPMTKPKINFFWSCQPFRLELKGYEGNCSICFKKNDQKLYTIAKERPQDFDFPKRMEAKYGCQDQGGRKTKKPTVFYRKNRSAKDIIEESKQYKGSVEDDSDRYDPEESCDIYSQCGK